ncbi:MAG: oxygen-independent coproporphyrinogen III oxidase [Tissierellales bacterium]|nr:oxygen-independent coproporphyrinogen III oxidase [Tissierellales bacterium]
MKELGVYIHIPFCLKKCNYCDFVSFSSNDKKISEYINYITKEIQIYRNTLNEDYIVNSIFIGGGTPSLIDSKHLKTIIDEINQSFKVDSEAEITIEANPGTLDNTKLAIYHEIGINRISIGAQSLNDDILKKLGRIHNSYDVLDAVELIRTNQFKNYNIDMMIGLPDQTIYNVLTDLENVIKLKPTHISLYSLIIEEGTLFFELEKHGQLNLPNEDEERIMYHKAIELLEKNGYKQYEISNFAKEGFECRHNLKYWTLMPYIGLGLNSHSYIENTRYSNYSNFDEYYKKIKENKLPVSSEEYIDDISRMTEYIILGIRLNKGINKKHFKENFGIDIEDYYKDAIIKNKQNGNIYEDEETIKLTKKGLDFSNIVELDFYI